uniref:Dehydrogenase/reductase SDR family member 7-like n=1 Tax=Actinia tenebrosa TaxID=6105 RepID=A0A6P8I768_ACTTE
EVSNRNIKIVTVLPGPIATNIRIHSLRDTSDPDAPKVDLKQSKPMSAERCSYLMTVAMVNNVKEAWICNSPNLKQFYLAQYMPSLYEWLYEG